MSGLKYPINVQIEVTEDCNHRCFYCYNLGRSEFSDSKKMSAIDAVAIGRKIIDEVNPFNATITGGEPMLNMLASISLLRNLGRRGIKCSMNTNLTIANQEKLQEIKEANSHTRFLISVPSVDIDIFEKLTGKKTLPKLFENLEKIVSLGFESSVNIVMNSININSIYEIGKFLHQRYGISAIAATPALRPSSVDSDRSLFLDNEEVVRGVRQLIKLKDDFGIKVSVLTLLPYCILPEDLRKLEFLRRGCSAGRTGVQIGYKGDVRSCGHSPLNEGNILTEKFTDIWERMRTYREDNYVPKECDGCGEVQYCKGGCRYEGLKTSDEKNSPDSRMVQKLEKSLAQTTEEEFLDGSRTYKVSAYRIREESLGVYTLFNGHHILTANDSMLLFMKDIKHSGFRLNSFPEDVRPIAIKMGKKLKLKGFLK